MFADSRYDGHLYDGNHYGGNRYGGNRYGGNRYDDNRYGVPTVVEDNAWAYNFGLEPL